MVVAGTACQKRTRDDIAPLQCEVASHSADSQDYREPRSKKHVDFVAKERVSRRSVSTLNRGLRLFSEKTDDFPASAIFEVEEELSESDILRRLRCEPSRRTHHKSLMLVRDDVVSGKELTPIMPSTLGSREVHRP